MTPAMQRDVEKLVKKFAEELLGIYREAVIASLAMTGGAPRAEAAPAVKAPKAPRAAKAVAAKAPKAAHKGRTLVKSSPEQVEALSVRIIDFIKKSGKRPAAKEIQQALKVAAGPFQYALNKLKDDGRVRQVGERRMARYEVSGKGGAVAAKKAPKARSAKPKASPAAEAPAAEPVVIATETTPSEA